MSEQNLEVTNLSDHTQSFISGYAAQQLEGMDSSLIASTIDFLDGEECFFKNVAQISKDGAMVVVDALHFPPAINRFYLANQQSIIKYGKATAHNFDCDGLVGIISTNLGAKNYDFDQLTNAIYDTDDDGAETYDQFTTEVRCAAARIVIDDLCTAYVGMLAQQVH